MVLLELRPESDPKNPSREGHSYAARVPLVGEYIHDSHDLDQVFRRVVRVSIGLHRKHKSLADEPAAIIFYAEPGEE